MRKFTITLLGLAAVSCGTKSAPSDEVDVADTGTVQGPVDTGVVPGADSGDSETTDTAVGSDSGGAGHDTGEAPSPAGWRSALFPDDWTAGFSVETESGLPAALQDYSYAGYRAGEEPLPALTLDGAVSVLDHGADGSGLLDSTDAIQAAIDAVADLGGGVVHLPAGTYRVDGMLSVTHSDTVVAGDGATGTFISFTRSDAMSDTNHLQFSGTLSAGPPTALAIDVGPGDRRLPLGAAGDFSVGDRVGIGMVISEDFVGDHEMDGLWTFAAGDRRTIFKRTITAVDADATPPTVTIDVPIRYPMRVRDGADVRRETGAITGCGMEGISVSTAVDWAAAWSNDRNHAVGFLYAEDCWVRDLGSWAGLVGDEDHHLQSGGILIKRSRRMTVADSTLEKAQNRGGGGNGYLYEIMQSDEVLIRDSTGRAGRHNFIQNWDFGTTGCVFLRTLSEDGEAWADSSGWWAPMGASEYHHALAMANLVDQSTVHDGWAAKNRMTWSSGAGHSATQCVFWNTAGTGSLESLQYGMGYVIGTDGLTVRTDVIDFYDSEGTGPEDWVEGIDEGAELWPPSLYEEQLRRRGF